MIIIIFVTGLILDLILPVLFFVLPREGSNGETQPLINKQTIPLPHVTYLTFAALVHLIGNVTDIVGGDSELSYVFL